MPCKKKSFYFDFLFNVDLYYSYTLFAYIGIFKFWIEKWMDVISVLVNAFSLLNLVTNSVLSRFKMSKKIDLKFHTTRVEGWKRKDSYNVSMVYIILARLFKNIELQLFCFNGFRPFAHYKLHIIKTVIYRLSYNYFECVCVLVGVRRILIYTRTKYFNENYK